MLFFSIRNFRICFILSCFLMFSYVFPCYSAESQTVGSLGDVSLSLNEIQDRVESFDSATKEMIDQNPQLLIKIVEDELRQKFVLAEAKKKKSYDAKKIDYLAERAKNQLIIDSYLNKIAEVPDGFPPLDVVMEVYEQNKEKFIVPAQINLAQIFLAEAGDASEVEKKKTQEKADKLAKSAQSPETDFGKIARKNSEHEQSAQQGGIMGMVQVNTLLPEIRQAVENLEPGKVSSPVKTSQGWHIFKVMERQPQYMRPILEVKNQIVEALQQRKTTELRQKYLVDLLKDKTVSINDKMLLKIKNN